MSVYNEAIKLIIDYIVLIVLLVVDVIIDWNPFVVQRGFFPNDETLMHPLKIETVNWKILLILSILIPTVVIFLVEILLSIYENSSKVQLTDNVSIPLFSYRILKNVYLHWLVLLVTFFITDVLKFRVGRLRPHFLTVCNLSLPNIQSNTSFIDDSTLCTGSKVAISVARQSFPSGHSSMSMSAVTSLIIYMHKKFWADMPSTRFPLQAISLGLLSIVIYVATSRLMDYWHHPLDVISGVILGFIVTVIVYYSQSDYFNKIKNPESLCNSKHYVGESVQIH